MNGKMIQRPVVIMHELDDGKIECLVTGQVDDYRKHGILVCDYVRHVANAFGVKEADVWEWVDKERLRHTSPIRREGVQ